MASSQIRVIKTNLIGAALRTPGLTFEKVWKKQYSLQIGAGGYVPSSEASLFLNPVLENREFTSAKRFGYTAVLEYRVYTQRARRDPTKPYISGFIRYYSYTSELNFKEESFDYTMDGKYSNASLGIQYGVQWIIRNKYSIDLTLVGVGISFNDLSGTVVTNDPEPKMGRLEDDFSEIPFIGSRFQFKGQEGAYGFGDRFTTASFRVALYFGFLI